MTVPVLPVVVIAEPAVGLAYLSENPVQSDRIFGWHQAPHILTSLVFNQQNVNHTGRTGIVGKGLCDRAQLRAPANNKSIYGSAKTGPTS